MDQNCDFLTEIFLFLNKQKQNITCNEILNKLNELVKILEDKIRENCNHDLENDYIDISEDNSQKICYCKKCLLTF